MKVHAEVSPKNGLLSKRESEVLGLLAEGNSREGVADLLFRSRSTVNTYTNNILNKMDSRNIVEAVAKAVVLGILKFEKTLCLALVVCMSMHSVMPSTSYAADLTEKPLPEQPFLRVRVRSGRRRED